MDFSLFHQAFSGVHLNCPENLPLQWPLPKERYFSEPGFPRQQQRPAQNLRPHTQKKSLPRLWTPFPSLVTTMECAFDRCHPYIVSSSMIIQLRKSNRAAQKATFHACHQTIIPGSDGRRLALAMQHWQRWMPSSPLHDSRKATGEMTIPMVYAICPGTFQNFCHEMSAIHHQVSSVSLMCSCPLELRLSASNQRHAPSAPPSSFTVISSPPPPVVPFKGTRALSSPPPTCSSPMSFTSGISAVFCVAVIV